MASMRPGEMPIGKLAKELEISTATINFYVKQGVLPAPRKLNRTRAAYAQSHRRLLVLIKRMQASGYSLEHIRRAFDHFGTDEEGLKKLEGIGYLQPLPPVRNDPDRRPIELFEPVDRDTFSTRASVAPELLERLEDWGVLRPVAPDRYDARDLHLVRTIKSLLDDGIPLERLAFLGGLVPVARDVSWLLMALAQRYLPELRDRRRRFTELVEPFLQIFAYVINRVNDEQHPDWRERLYTGDEEASPAGT